MQLRWHLEVGSVRLSNDHGTIMVEYAVQFTVVALGLCLSMTVLGVPLIKVYLTQQTGLLLPLP
jgi:hypothetical protein